MIFHSKHGRQLTQFQRWLLLAWSLLLLAGFGLAVALEPDARGYGTHQALGFPPCTVRVLLGMPCPSCGMTTSFSYFVRGQFIAAAHANAAGLLLALICAVMIPWCWLSAAAGRFIGFQNPITVGLWFGSTVCLSACCQWLVWVWPQL